MSFSESVPAERLAASVRPPCPGTFPSTRFPTDRSSLKNDMTFLSDRASCAHLVLMSGFA